MRILYIKITYFYSFLLLYHKVERLATRKNIYKLGFLKKGGVLFF